MALCALGIAGCATSNEVAFATPDASIEGEVAFAPDASIEGGHFFDDAAPVSMRAMRTPDSMAPTGALADASDVVEAASVDGEAGACVPHHGPPVIDPTALPACSCPGAHCVPIGLVPPDSVSLLADCNSASKCVPDSLIESGGHVIFPTCSSVGGAEGRCLSRCLPVVSARASLLPQSSCAAGELCAPCFDPLTGKSTGACNQSCDPGPQRPPVQFASCCGGQGTCVPSAIVPADQRGQLAAGDCPADNNNNLCAPTELASAGSAFAAPTCRSFYNAEGRCLSTCLPDIATKASLLPPSTCAAGHLCAPCYDPITGADTRACHIAADSGPGQPPVTFPKCCGGSGTCVPSSIVPDTVKGQLSTDGCPLDASQFLCAPNEFTTQGGFTLPTCRSLGGGEGRCLSVCLPAIAPRASTLPQSTCMAGHVCAPCYDPLTGADTKACHISNDPGPQEPPFMFPGCCRSRGVCVPMSLVPTRRQTQLGQDTCSHDQDYLCVAPRDFALDPSYKPPSCSGSILFFYNYTGVCLPDCLAAFSGLQGLIVPRGSCANDGDKCAPCVDPVTRGTTGACN